MSSGPYSDAVTDLVTLPVTSALKIRGFPDTEPSGEWCF